MRNRFNSTPSAFLVGMVRCTLKEYSVKVGDRQRKPKGGGEPITEEVYEDFVLPSPVGYDITQLRAFMRSAVVPVIAGQQKKVEMTLERWPEVNTVMGEIVAHSPRKLRFGYTSSDEQNTLFVVEAI